MAVVPNSWGDNRVVNTPATVGNTALYSGAFSSISSTASTTGAVNLVSTPASGSTYLQRLYLHTPGGANTLTISGIGSFSLADKDEAQLPFVNSLSNYGSTSATLTITATTATEYYYSLTTRNE